MVKGLVLGLLGFGRASEGESREDAAEAGRGDDDPDPWVPVLTVFNMAQAALAVARLQDEGIPARLRQEAASRAIPVNVGLLGMIDVMVPESMADRALDILEDLGELDEQEGADAPETP
ncbi:MAG TPA: DUF2007 domain-containing protein [Chloroflexi bacterium]|nr:DUF2007 domain-containing protein [Chloroflexota bacterium]